MSFRIRGLAPEPFQHLYGLSDVELSKRGVQRYVADKTPGFPNRIEMRDARPGETLLLVNYTHQPAETPYRASHAIFIREGAMVAYDRTGETPEVMLLRPISLRAFDQAHYMVDADLVDGPGLESCISRLLEGRNVAYLHAHYAKRGCFAARIDRT